MRVLLFTGKGGVGKTTLAAASAVRLAEFGQKVLVCSTDPAHSLGDALGSPVGSEPREVEPGLSAVQLDTRALLVRQWSAAFAVLTTLVGAEAPAAASGLQAAELTVLPGVEEMLALAEVRRLAEMGLWDVLVLDCGPTAETLRMVALPDAVSGYLQRLWPKHRRVLQSALGRAGSPLGAVADALDRWEQEAAGVQALLTDPVCTSVRLVLTPERVVLAETRRTVTSLALHGLRLDGLVVNRMVPAPRGAHRSSDPALAWLRTRVAEQDAVLAQLRAQLPAAVPTTLVAHRGAEPVGVGELSELACQLYRDQPVLTDPHGQPPPVRGAEVSLESGTGVSSVYLWRLPLPGVQDAEVELDRMGDDVLVTVGGQRRRMLLAPVLRRCHAFDAQVVPGALVVRFRPDPDVWVR